MGGAKQGGVKTNHPSSRPNCFSLFLNIRRTLATHPVRLLPPLFPAPGSSLKPPRNSEFVQNHPRQVCQARFFPVHFRGACAGLRSEETLQSKLASQTAGETLC